MNTNKDWKIEVNEKPLKNKEGKVVKFTYEEANKKYSQLKLKGIKATIYKDVNLGLGWC
jgi:hypothetical protein